MFEMLLHLSSKVLKVDYVREIDQTAFFQKESN
jgi:hypothetical protein